MRKILIDPFPAPGHFSAAIDLAVTFRAQGDYVIFIGLEQFRKRIERLHFQFCVVNPQLVVHERVLDMQLSRLRFLRYMVRSKFEGLRQREIDANVKAYDALMADIKPDLIVVDFHHEHKIGFYTRYNLPIFSFQLLIEPSYNLQVYPFQFARHPPKKFPVQKLWICWQRFMIMAAIRRFVLHVLALGQSSKSLHAKVTGIKTFNYKTSYGVVFPNVINITVVPKEFDFPQRIFCDKVRFVDVIPCIRETGADDERLISLLMQMRSPDASGRSAKIIICSLGSMSFLEEKKALKIFERVMEASQQLPGVKWIFSSSIHYEHLLSKSKLMKAENLVVLPWINQRLALSFADGMVTHGGMNTIRECIYYNIPMLVIPLSLHWDQPGNAARVDWHGIGIHLSYADMTLQKILVTVKEIIYNRAYRNNIRKMSQQISSHENETLI